MIQKGGDKVVVWLNIIQLSVKDTLKISIMLLKKWSLRGYSVDGGR
jgi:hypothetical protein